MARGGNAPGTPDLTSWRRSAFGRYSWPHFFQTLRYTAPHVKPRKEASGGDFPALCAQDIWDPMVVSMYEPMLLVTFDPHVNRGDGEKRVDSGRETFPMSGMKSKVTTILQSEVCGPATTSRPQIRRKKISKEFPR